MSKTMTTARRSGANNCSGEVVGVEWAQVLDPFADANQLHGDAKLLGDRQRDPALRRTVELRQGNAGDVDGLAEEHRLTQAVLAGGRVDREQRLVRRAGQLLLDHAA